MMTLGLLSPSGRSFDFGACFLDHGYISEPAGEPYHGNVNHMLARKRGAK
jgi:hypothetical protein